MKRLMLLALVVSGCEMFDDDAETTLAKNHARWRALGIHDYDFRFQRECFCVWTEPVIIEVRGDTVANVRLASTGESPPVGPYYWWPTIDSSRLQMIFTGRSIPRCRSRQTASARTICTDISSRPPNAPPIAG